MPQDLITKIVDREALLSDFEFTAGIAEDIIEAIKKVNAVKFNISTATDIKTASEGIKNLRLETEKLATMQVKATEAVKQRETAQKQAKSTEDEIQKVYEKRQKLEEANAKILIEEKELLRQLTGELKNRAREENAAEGSIEQMRATLIRLNKEYDNLSKAQREAGEGQALQQNIRILSDELKQLEGQTGRFQRSVGQYAEALKPAFAGIRAELQALNEKIQATDQSDPQFDVMAQQAKALEVVLQGIDKTFGSTRQEMKAYQEAARLLGQQFGTTNQIFQDFVKQVGEQKDTLDDIQATINFNASDTKFLDGIVEATGAAVGGYGALEAASTLFGEETDDLNKRMVELQAVLTLVTSVQSILNALQSESAAAQTVMALKTGLINAALKVENLLLSRNTAATAANATAQTGAAGAAALTTVAMEGQAAAAGTATAATIGLRTALISTGIGAIIIGIIIGITKLAGAVNDWIAGDERAIEIQKGLSEALNELADKQIELTEATRVGVAERVKAMERELAVMKAAGITAEKGLALENVIADQRRRNAALEMIQNDVTQASRDGIHGRYMKSLEDEATIQEEILQLNFKAKRENEKVDEDELKALQTKLDAQKAVSDGYKQQYDYQNKLVEDYNAADQQLKENAARADKMRFDEQRKISLEQVKSEQDLVQTKNNIILSSDLSTFDQRLKAMQSNVESQKAVLRAEREFTKSDREASNNEKLLADKKYNTAVSKLNKEAAAQQEKAIRDNYLRNLQATTDGNAILLNERANAAKTLADNENASLAERLKANDDYFAASVQIADEAFALELERAKKTGKTQQEQENITAAHLGRVLQLEKNYSVASQQIFDSAAAQKRSIDDKFLEFILQFNNQQLQSQLDYVEGTEKLNEKYRKGQISIEKYNQKKAENEYKYQQESLLQEIAKNDNALKNANITEEKRREIAANNAALRKQFTDNETQYFISNEERKRAAIVQTFSYIQTYGSQVMDIIGQALQGSIDAQKQALQEQINAVEERYAKEIEAVQNSTASEQDKAAKIKILEASKAEQKRQLEQKQREADLRKARFDKAKAISDIILGTAVAIAQSLAKPFLIPIIAALGAAQLAVAIAQPLPKYKYGAGVNGRPEHPGGPAIVGDGGVREVGVLPGGQHFFTPSTSTIMDLPAGTKIFPNVQDYEASLRNAALKSFRGTTIAPNTGFTGNEMAYMQLNATMQGVRKAIEGKEVANFTVTWDGANKLTKAGKSWKKWLNTQIKY